MANATTAVSTTTLMGQITAFSQMPLVRQVVFMLILASSIALGVSVVLWSRDQDYSVLFADASSQDNADIITVLEQNQFPYEIDPRSGVISVPTAQVQQTRLTLATQGLPRAANTGFDSLQEGSALGTSNFVEQARYNRALEQELVTTIKLIRGVRDARVHLSIPKQNSFVRTGSKPSASVMLDITQAISDIQIAGIAHLVSSSVAGMNSENVSIVDQKGTLLSKQLNSEFQASSEQMKFTRELEQEYTQRIMSILGPVVGEGKVRAQVTAELDFTVVETTEENYDPNEVVVRSEQTQEENRVDPSAVVPGQLTPVPPVQQDPNALLANADINTIDQANLALQQATQSLVSGPTRLNSTRNYEIDRSVSHRRSVPGSISRLSVAVVVDLQPVTADGTAAPVDPAQSADKIARLTQLVKDTIGFNEARGDSVNVISEVFTAAAPLPEQEPTPIWQQSWIGSVAKQLGASLVVLLLIFGVLRPAMKTVIKPAVALAGSGQLLAAGGGHSSHGGAQVAAGLLSSAEMQEKLPEKSEYDVNLQLAQNLVKNEPARAARMIKEWVAND